ncbi:MAG: acetylxylan esterase, partial [Bradyrhizobium sp.]|nr:acetylxylan esterase [Bradyrhizobium sp.]
MPMIRMIVALALCLMWPVASLAQDKGVVRVTSDVSYEFLARWDTDRLNKILTIDTPKFASVTVIYRPAVNAGRLYRITYASVVPERGNKPIRATGLLAVPEITETSLPMVSYQHGTVYGKQEVPSFPEQSPETQLMIAQFAGQGHLLIGADYFGMGTSTEPEGYMVKASHQQATYDMLIASRAVLNDMHLTPTRLSIAGWSQGGFVTMAFLEKLESAGMPVAAAATASAPVDVFVALHGFLNFPRSNDASWVNSLFILSAFAFENYYAVPGLARSVVI